MNYTTENKCESRFESTDHYRWERKAQEQANNDALSVAILSISRMMVKTEDRALTLANECDERGMKIKEFDKDRKEWAATVAKREFVIEDLKEQVAHGKSSYDGLAIEHKKRLEQLMFAQIAINNLVQKYKISPNDMKKIKALLKP